MPFGKGRLASAEVANISSPLSTGDTLDTLNLWFWMPKELITKGTMERVWQYGNWDLTCCARGEFLPFDWDGNMIQKISDHPRRMCTGRIAGPHVLAMHQVTADTEYHANHMGLKHWQNLHPCDFCPADAIEGSAYNYSDFGPDSKWMQEQVTRDEWVQNVTPYPLRQACPLIGFSIFSIGLDILHVVDLGVLALQDQRR